MVEEWDRWRRGCEPGESALIVHGPNSDVDLVNELAQQKRLQHAELGDRAVRAVDRDYLLRPGDVVAVRNAAHTLGPPPQERVARERWKRAARRLDALRTHSGANHHPASPPPPPNAPPSPQEPRAPGRGTARRGVRALSPGRCQ